MALPLHLDPNVPGSPAARRAALAEAPGAPLYLFGLDLGQTADYSALVVCQRTTDTTGAHKVHSYGVVHIRRWPLKTSYTQIVHDTVERFAVPPLAGSILAIDATGVGRPVVNDLFGRSGIRAKVRPIVITGGTRSGPAEDGSLHVAKTDLIGALLAVVGTRRFAIAHLPPLSEMLQKELSTFKRKINVATGNESLESWRESDKDDMVLATALPVWLGERGMLRLNIFC